jgi:hypothetical protein
MSSISESHWSYLILKQLKSRVYDLFQNLTISNPSLKAVLSNESPYWTLCFCGWISVFLKEEIQNDVMTPCSPLNSLTYFLLSHLQSMGWSDTIMSDIRFFFSQMFYTFCLHNLTLACFRKNVESVGSNNWDCPRLWDKRVHSETISISKKKKKKKNRYNATVINH